jgi:hypothetical protein
MRKETPECILCHHSNPTAFDDEAEKKSRRVFIRTSHGQVCGKCVDIAVAEAQERENKLVAVPAPAAEIESRRYTHHSLNRQAKTMMRKIHQELGPGADFKGWQLVVNAEMVGMMVNYDLRGQPDGTQKGFLLEPAMPTNAAGRQIKETRQNVGVAVMQTLYRKTRSSESKP